VRVQAKRPSLFFMVLLMGGVLCPLLMGQQAPAPLTNRDIVKMVKGGVPESVIISSIQSSPSNFDLSPDALIRLHRLGVPKKIMDAMMAAGTKAATPQTPPPAPDASPLAATPDAAPPAPAPPPADAPQPAVPADAPPASANAFPADSAPSAGLPTVAFLQADVPQPIALEKTQLEETKTKPSSMLSLASDSALTPVVQGEVSLAAGQLAGHLGSGIGSASVGQAGGLISGILAHRTPSQTYVWAVPNPASINVLPTRSPVFLVDFSDVPGINPAEYRPTIVKLTPTQNTWRLVGATQGKVDATSSSALDWQIYQKFLEDSVPLRAQKKSSGHYQISPSVPLLPGEYAVVLRPISKSKKFSGADVARAQGDGLAFDSVWSFQVPLGAQ
jgi:hypothetical protein